MGDYGSSLRFGVLVNARGYETASALVAAGERILGTVSTPRGRLCNFSALTQVAARPPGREQISPPATSPEASMPTYSLELDGP
jgi:hypothetical protein